MDRFIAVLLSGFVLGSTPGLARAQDAPPVEEDDFKRYTSEAAQAYEAGEYERAAELFEKAYGIRPVSNILYNIARIHEESGNIDMAIEYYDKFVVAPKVENNARKDALERLKTLREVKADQERKEQEAVVAQEETEPPPVVEPEPPVVEPQPRTARTLGWVFLSVGAGSLAASGVIGLLAQGQFSKFQSATSLEERRGASNTGRTQSIVADSLLVTGIVTAVVGGVVLIASGGSAEKARATAHRSWSVTPLVGERAAGMGLEFTF